MKLLDLFCGAGGAAMGYHRAGFDTIVGIDIAPQPHYPFAFVQADALEYVKEHGQDFDVIHASPPCQRWSISNRHQGRADKHPDLLTPIRELLSEYRWTVIENVPPVPIRLDLALTGPTVGLNHIERLRHFELSFLLPQPRLKHVPRWMWESGKAITVTKSLASSSHFYPRKRAGLPGRVPVADACAAMGIEHPMTSKEVGEAIPPAYTEYIGKLLLEAAVYDSQSRPPR